MSSENSINPLEVSDKVSADSTWRSTSASFIPEDVASALAEARMRLCASARASSAFLDTTPLMDVTATTITRSTATSSSSPSCESRAAAMNSLATEKLIDADKSAPMFESASVVADTAPAMSMRQPPAQREQAPSVHKPPQALLQSLFYSRPGACAAILFGYDQMERTNTHARRLFEAPILRRQLDRYLACQTFFLSLPQASGNAAGKKRRSDDVQHRTSAIGTECAGCVYGCALGNIVHYCAHNGSSIPAMMRKIHEMLVPVATAVLSESGKDANTMCAGIAAHRIARSQQLRMGGQIEKTIHRRQANPAIVVGLVASIYCVYAILSYDLATTPKVSRAYDVAWFVKNNLILQSLGVAEYILTSSTPPRHGPGNATEFEISADEAELRAVARAIQGVKTATSMAAQNGFDEYTTFSMQLSFLSKAAWPTNERIGPDTQTALLKRLGSPIFFTSGPHQQAPHGPISHPGMIVPLSQLSGVESRAIGGKGATDTDSSSIATGSSHRHSSNPSSGASSIVGSEFDVSPFLALGLS